MKKIKHLIIAAIISTFFTQPLFAKSGDVVIRGVVSAIDGATITVNTTTYTIQPFTEFEDQNENQITFASFNVGSLVKIKLRAFEGDLALHSVELESDLSGGSDDSSDKNIGDDEGSKSKEHRKRGRNRVVQCRGRR